jgi:hypothetical protein
MKPSALRISLIATVILFAIPPVLHVIEWWFNYWLP